MIEVSHKHATFDEVALALGRGAVRLCDAEKKMMKKKRKAL